MRNIVAVVQIVEGRSLEEPSVPELTKREKEWKGSFGEAWRTSRRCNGVLPCRETMQEAQKSVGEVQSIHLYTPASSVLQLVHGGEDWWSWRPSRRKSSSDIIGTSENHDPIFVY